MEARVAPLVEAVAGAAFWTVILHPAIPGVPPHDALGGVGNPPVPGTNTELTAVEIALRYKQLWMVEQLFRTAKSLLDTRPIFHKFDATICGHVFCSFLALVLRDELFRRIDSAGVTAEWDDILRDLNALTETAITYNGKTFAVRSNVVGVAGKIAQCVGVRLPNTVRQVDVEKEVAEPSP